ncbi:MAG TPA: hypothetical protein VHS27_18695 [Gaiellales bacterium]|jgi:hypothetical protein|nr:hypothetical protein [Gaiellales bacterium]
MQLIVMTEDIKAHVHPDVSIEIVYPLTHEDWGLTRFFLRGPNGP